MKLLPVIAWVLAAPVAASELRIEVHPRVQLAGGSLRLGQLARLESDDVRLLQAVVDLPVGRLLPSGRAQWVSSRTLQAAVERALGGPDVTLRWTGATACEVESATAIVPGEAIARAAAGVAGNQAQPMRVPRDLRVPAGAVTLTGRLPAAGLAAGRQLVWVEVRSAGAWVRTVPVTVQVGAASIDVGVHAAVVRTAKEERTGPAVERGQSATLRSGTGDVLAETRVEVLQDGRDGERVLVRSVSAPAPLAARVVGPDLLEMDR